MTIHMEDAHGTRCPQDFEYYLSKCAELMGVDLSERGLTIPFFNRAYRITPEIVEDIQGNKPTESVERVLCHYILHYPKSPPPVEKRVTFRELSGAAPLVSSFTRNTNKLIASAFASDPESLIARADYLNGETEIDMDGWDVSVRFQALPDIPVFLRLNAAEDQFPAQCSLLFFQSAVRYLNLKSLFVLGTWLAGHLISDEDA